MNRLTGTLIRSAAFNEAPEFHPTLGPGLFVVFSFIANYLLLTVLISLLTSAFAAVQSTETESVLFQRAIKTIERCHSEVRDLTSR